MPTITVDWIKGRTVDQKRTIAERFTNAMQEVGVDPDGLYIVFNDVERDWARAGTLFCDR